jgi:hypothetical protein
MVLMSTPPPQSISILDTFADISDIKDAISELAKTVEAIPGIDAVADAAAIAVIQTRVDAANTNISANTEDIAALQSSVSTANTNIASLQTSVTDLQSSVSDLQTSVSTANTNIASLQTSVSDLQAETPCLTIYRDVADTYNSSNSYVRFDGTVGIQSGITFSSAANQGTRFTVPKNGVYVIDYSLFGDANGGSSGNNTATPNFELVDGTNSRVSLTPALSVPENGWNGILNTYFITRLVSTTSYRVRLTNASFTTLFGLNLYTNNSMQTYNAPGSNNTSAIFSMYKL